jgi:hypothetical protein
MMRICGLCKSIAGVRVTMISMAFTGLHSARKMPNISVKTGSDGFGVGGTLLMGLMLTNASGYGGSYDGRGTITNVCKKHV